MKKYTFLGMSFILFAFTMPATSFNSYDSTVSVKIAPVPETTPDLPEIPQAAEISVAATDLSSEISISAEDSYEKFVNDIYDINDLRRLGLKKDIFKRAMVGFYNLKDANRLSSFKSILTIVDFNKSGKDKRLWVIDLKSKKLLHRTLVSHGRGSGGDKASAFSNEPNSHQSSVGFYLTSNTYHGKHGLSLKLDGLDRGFNTNARERAIVIHGASYVSSSFVKQNGYLGRSHGCPALPEDLNEEIINIIKDKTVLYIEGPVKSYSSVYLDRNKAIAEYSQEARALQASL